LALRPLPPLLPPPPRPPLFPYTTLFRSLEGDRARAWSDSYQAANPLDDSLHPVHVWWHTLSHRVLRALSVDSGYSSAAIQERVLDRKSTRLNSSHVSISYAVFCLKKKKS